MKCISSIAGRQLSDNRIIGPRDGPALLFSLSLCVRGRKDAMTSGSSACELICFPV